MLQRKREQRGFTLIELMIVIVILGILAAMGLANYVRMKQNARRASCFSNQHHVCEQAILYTMDNNQGGAVTLNVTALEPAYLVQEVGECPESGNNDYDDYTINLNSYRIVSIVCDVQPARHQFKFNN